MQTHIVPTLFNLGTPTVAKSRAEILREKCLRAQQNVAKKQSPIWKAAVIEYAVHEFLPFISEPFLAEKLRTFYDRYAALHGKPVTAQSKAFNGRMSALLKMKVIEALPPERREVNSVFARSYKSLIYRGTDCIWEGGKFGDVSECKKCHKPRHWHKD